MWKTEEEILREIRRNCVPDEAPPTKRSPPSQPNQDRPIDVKVVSAPSV